MHKTPHDQGCYQVPPNSINSCFGGTEQPLDLQWGGGAIHHPWGKKRERLVKFDAGHPTWSLSSLVSSLSAITSTPASTIHLHRLVSFGLPGKDQKFRKAFEKMCCDLSSRKQHVTVPEFPQVQYWSQVWALRFPLVCQFRSYTRPLALPEDTMIIQYQGLPSFCKYVQISKYIYIH